MNSSSLHVCLFSLIVIISLNACSPSTIINPEQLWTIDDLRALKQVEGVNPSQELIAVYTRIAGFDLQIRLDFLDLKLENDSDIYLVLDLHYAGTTCLPVDLPTQNGWDTLVIIPSVGIPQIFSTIVPEDKITGELNGCLPWQQIEDVIPRVARDPWNDTMVISLNNATLIDHNHSFLLQVFLTSPVLTPGPNNIVNTKNKRGYLDTIGPVRSDDVPMAQSSVIIAFWNTFPAYTPAQTLRRWDGAHTGPYGGRHGLQNLLQAVRRSKVPIILLDLKNSTSLSALDYIGGLPTVQNMAKNGFVILPDIETGARGLSQLTWHYSKIRTPVQQLLGKDWGVENTLVDNRQVGLDFGLSTSLLLYAPTLPFDALPDYQVLFIPMEALQPNPNQDISPMRWQNRTLIPIPPSTNNQATPDGLSIAVRRKLLELASTAINQTSQVFVMGGDFPTSTWGNPEIAQATFQYITTHPWIHPLNNTNILHLSPSSQATFDTDEESINLEPSNDYTFEQLINIPLQINPLYTAARQMYLSMLSTLPTDPPGLPALRANYIEQVAGLIAAADWATSPFSITDCTIDPDQDNQDECVLASEKYYAMFENDGGRLVFLVSKTAHGVHQWVAPTTQFMIGLADPSNWNLSAGAASDPDSIPGGFIDTPPPWPVYRSLINEAQITFTAPDGLITKTLTLNKDGLCANYETSEPVTIQIPLGIDPWSRFTPGWGNNYKGTWTTHGGTWSLDDKLYLDIQTSGKLNAFPFTASREAMKYFEDPNYEYPRGHYLPFPITLVEIQGKEQFSICLLINDR